MVNARKVVSWKICLISEMSRRFQQGYDPIAQINFLYQNRKGLVGDLSVCTGEQT